jgi:hypothetical protein
VVELRMGHITVRSPRVTGPDVVFVVDNVTAVREGLSICRSFRDSREAIAETERKSDLRAAGLGACA